MSDAPAGTSAGPGAFVASEDEAAWRFDGSLTFDNAATVLDASRALALPTSGRVDLSQLGVADSAALAVIFALKRRAKVEHRELRFEGIPASLASLARVYGVDALV